MIIERAETVERFAGLREEWNALLHVSAASCVFLTHEWLFTWWRHFSEGRRLSILTARLDGKLVGIAPLAVRNARYARMLPEMLEFLGSGVIGSDYLDVIAMPGLEDQVLDAFSDYLNRVCLILQLTHLKRGACLAAQLADRLQTGQWTAADTKINICPFINLENHNWETYLNTLSSSQRYNFNRRLKNLMKGSEVRLQSVTSPGDAQEGLNLVIELHRKRWSSVEGSEAFHTKSVVAFHKEFVDLAARQGWLRLLILRIDETPAAALYGLRYGRTFYFYQSGFDPAHSKQSVGLVMMGLAIKAAIEDGASEYDLLHGDEEYKFHWAHETRELGRIELYPRHARGRVYRRAVGLNRAARKMARRMLRKAYYYVSRSR